MKIESFKPANGYILGVKNNIAVVIKNASEANNLREFYDISGKHPQKIAEKATVKLKMDKFDNYNKPVILYDKFTQYVPDKNYTKKYTLISRIYSCDTKEKLLENITKVCHLV